MERQAKNNGTLERIRDQLVAQKQKTIMASCLILVMLFMWGKVFLKKKPSGANATGPASIANGDLQSNNNRVVFVELPFVEGRNDHLRRNFFDMNIGEIRKKDTEGHVKISNKDVFNRLKSKLRLSAISMDKNPQAFINGQLLSVGDFVIIRDGDNKYEFEIIKIEEKKVIIKFGNAELVLKFVNMIDTGY